MGLEKTFREFSTALLRLDDRLRELRVTVVEDRPSRNDGVVPDNLELAVEDLLGWLQEASAAAAAAHKAVQHPVDIDAARRALGTCQERFERMEQVFSSNLVSYEHMADLTSFGNERRGEWPMWVLTAKRGIDLCRAPMDGARSRLAECWQEIAERVGMTNISVHNSSIGQKIGSAADVRELERETIS
jgi:hypothetical protein